MKLFVSFASEDAVLKDELLRHLSILHRFGSVASWSSQQTGPGEDRAQEINKHVGSADVALVLLSAAWLASEDIQNLEVPELIRRKAERGLRVVPVLLRSCAWEFHPLVRGLGALPRDARAIAAHADDARDQVLADVVKEIATIAAGRTISEEQGELSTDPTPDGAVRRQVAAAEGAPSLKIFLEYLTFYELVQMVIVNSGVRPITIADISMSISTEPAESSEPFWDPVPSGVIYVHDNPTCTLPATLKEAEFRVLRLGEVVSGYIMQRANVRLAVYDILGNAYTEFSYREHNPKWGYYGPAWWR